MPRYTVLCGCWLKAVGRLLANSVLHLLEHIHEAPVLLVPCLKSGNPAAQDPKFRERMGRLEGASIYPAVQNIMLACRARAVLDGRFAPSIDDVLALAHPVLRHRMALSFSARADGVTLDDVIGRLCAPLA